MCARDCTIIDNHVGCAPIKDKHTCTILYIYTDIPRYRILTCQAKKDFLSSSSSWFSFAHFEKNMNPSSILCRVVPFASKTRTFFLVNLQQDEVLAELKEYARSDPKPQDAQAVELVVSYLEALNKIFERSILGKDDQ